MSAVPAAAVRFAGGVRGWTAAAEAYDRSFVTLCDGAAARLLADLPAGELLDVGYFADPGGHLWETA